jgi:DnaJ like chaperone protein
MGKYAKWIGGGLGWVLGHGPIGAVIGFVIGSLFDNMEASVTVNRGRTTPGDYAMSLLVLIAAMMKVDGKVVRSELDYVKKFLVQNFGEQGAKEALIMLKDLLKQDIPVTDVCEQITEHVNYSSRLQLLHFLNELAFSDGRMNASEERLLEVIANGLRITQADKESLRAMFKNTVEDWYKILEVDANASDEDVKKAYRRMAMKYHPDKVSTMGEDVKRAAHEKFQKLNEAYEKIKKERGMV